jgi:hypothetical protein
MSMRKLAHRLLAIALIGLCALPATAGAPDLSLAYLPFKPMNGANSHTLLPSVTVTATTTAQNVTLPVGDAGNNQIEILNGSTGVVSLNFGDSGVTAVVGASGYPVGPGQRRVITVDPFVTTASVLSSVSGVVAFTRGNGAN